MASKSIRLLSLLVALSLGCFSSGFAREEVAVFLETYCLDCHDKDTAKGDVVLEPFHEQQSLRMLFDVYDQTLLEYMPPKK